MIYLVILISDLSCTRVHENNEIKSDLPSSGCIAALYLETEELVSSKVLPASTARGLKIVLLSTRSCPDSNSDYNNH